MFYDADGGRHASVTPMAVRGFFDDYRFLSNFHVCPLDFEGLLYSSSEAAYMACKTFDLDKKMELQGLTPSQAKKFGRSLELISNWDTERVIAMTKVVFEKFRQNPDLLQKLKATGDKYLEETNDWNDRFWGADAEGTGQNMLGRILMLVRETL